jgi:hypothetical protein
MTIEFDNGDFRLSLFDQRTEHRAQSLHAFEFIERAAAALDSNDDRNRLNVEDFIELDRLCDAVIFDTEVPGVQTINNVALRASNESGCEHYGGLGAENLILCGSASNQQEQKKTDEEPVQHVISESYTTAAAAHVKRESIEFCQHKILGKLY